MGYRDKPVVIDDTDDDTARLMHPDRQQGYLDALTELSRQWGLRLKNIQSAVVAPLEGESQPKGSYQIQPDGRAQWRGPNGEHP